MTIVRRIVAIPIGLIAIGLVTLAFLFSAAGLVVAAAAKWVAE